MEKPAIFGGEPLFKEILPIIKPTLFNPVAILPEIEEIFYSGSVTASKYVKRFEDACGDYLGVRHAIAFSSATNALILSIKGLGLRVR